MNHNRVFSGTRLEGQKHVGRRRFSGEDGNCVLDGNMEVDLKFYMIGGFQ